MQIKCFQKLVDRLFRELTYGDLATERGGIVLDFFCHSGAIGCAGECRADDLLGSEGLRNIVLWGLVLGVHVFLHAD